MKKFLKAVALATVMCMLLSVSAFAADSTATGDKTSQTIDITISTGATAAEQVAVLIVDSEVTDLSTVEDSQIMYIDQVTTGADGTATISDVQLLDSTTVVDVYIGSATLGTAQLIGDDIDLNDVKKITIVTGDAVVKATGTAESGKHGYAAAITANVPAGLKIVAAKWAFKVSGDWMYSATVLDHNQAALATEGAVQFAAAFNAYTEADGKFNALDITDVAVIFLTGESIDAAKDDEANTHYVADDTTAADLKADGPFKNN